MEKKDHVLLGAALTVGAVEGWLDEHVDPETGYVVDDTLAIEGAAADSKATGEAIAAVEAAIPAVDATLATTGAAADAKKTGDEIDGLKSAITAIGYTETAIDISDYDVINGTMQSTGQWAGIDGTNYQSALITDIPKSVIVTPASGHSAYISFFSQKPTQPQSLTGQIFFCTGETGRRTIAQGETETLDVPSDCACIVVTVKSGGTDFTPTMTGVFMSGMMDDLQDEIDGIQSQINSTNSNIDSIEEEVYYTPEKTLVWVENLANVGNFTTMNGDKVTKPFTLYKGETVAIATKGDGSYMFRAISKMDSLDATIAAGYSGGTLIQQITANSLTTYTYTATDDEEYIVLGGLMDDTTTVTFSNLKRFSTTDKLQNEIDAIESHDLGILRGKSIMFFGDSLTSGSGEGIKEFAERIAGEYGLPYRRFITDSADGNLNDVAVTYPCVTNYGKDGTCNRIVTGRTDSVVERVKRHIVAATVVDYVLIECCVNDMAQELRSKGTISESYTAEYDTTTTIGALEETLRYLTNLGKPMRVGGWIPWQISWQTANWFDDYAAVFEKWGVPLYDMRKCAGFDFAHCAAHRAAYSLSSDSYSDYDNTETYDLDDRVKYSGVLYKCLANGVTGIPPTDTTKWMEVSSEAYDGTHLNDTGHAVVAGKIQAFIEHC